MIFADSAAALKAAGRMRNVLNLSVLRDMREEIRGTPLSHDEEWVADGIADWRMSFEPLGISERRAA